MPIYEFYCTACDSEFELIRPVSRADDPVECKTCQQPATRQISNFSFKSDTFTAPKLRNKPGEVFRGNRTEGAPDPESQTRDPSAG